MTYEKPATSIDEQVALLRRRGMTIGDDALARRWFETVGYYRLSIYWLPFEEAAPEGRVRSRAFRPGTDLEDVRDLYVFDRKPRLLVTEAIERVEVAVRARWTNRLALAEGSHGYANPKAFTSREAHLSLLAALTGQLAKSRETMVTHYLERYAEPALPPLWVATETMTLGELSRWVKATADPGLKDALARDLGLPNKDVLTGVLEALTYTRNVCAHHGRLWNRRMVKYVPNIRRLSESLALDRARASGTTNTIYNILTVLAHMLRHQSPDTSWPTRVKGEVGGPGELRRRGMGMPRDWQDRPVWRGVP